MAKLKRILYGNTIKYNIIKNNRFLIFVTIGFVFLGISFISGLALPIDLFSFIFMLAVFVSALYIKFYKVMAGFIKILPSIFLVSMLFILSYYYIFPIIFIFGFIYYISFTKVNKKKLIADAIFYKNNSYIKVNYNIKINYTDPYVEKYAVVENSQDEYSKQLVISSENLKEKYKKYIINDIDKIVVATKNYMFKIKGKWKVKTLILYDFTNKNDLLIYEIKPNYDIKKKDFIEKYEDDIKLFDDIKYNIQLPDLEFDEEDIEKLRNEYEDDKNE
ncbi:MAG: hypothetical protein QXF15_02495 [Candidatus Aenigmatarchaeota archaeon]